MVYININYPLFFWVSLIILSLVLTFCAPNVFAADFTPSGNITGRGIYRIYNFTNVTADFYYGDGSQLTNLLGNTSAQMQAAVNQSGLYYDINVNSSNYWDGLDSPTDIQTSLLNNDEGFVTNLTMNNSANSSDYWDSLNTPSDIDTSDLTNDAGFVTNITMNQSIYWGNVDGAPSFVTNDTMNHSVYWDNVDSAPAFITNDTMNKSVNWSNVLNSPSFITNDTMNKTVDASNLINTPVNCTNGYFMTALNPGGTSTCGLVEAAWNSTAWKYGTYVTLTPSVNVGIGTATPTEKLTIAGNISTTTGAYFATSSGNVGIGNGMTAPTSKVEINGSTKIYSTSADGAEALQLREGYLTLYSATANNDNGLRIWNDANDAGASIQSYDASSFSTEENLFLNPNGGFVSVGTISPTEEFEIFRDQDAGTKIKVLNNNTGGSATAGMEWWNGAGATQYSEIYRIASGLTTIRNREVGADIRFYTATGGENLRILDSGNLNLSGESRALYIHDNSAAKSTVVQQDNTGVWFGSYFADPIRFVAGNAEKARMDSSGNWGLGTTTGTEKLSVSGNLSTSGAAWLKSTVNTGAVNQLARGLSTEEVYMSNSDGQDTELALQVVGAANANYLKFINWRGTTATPTATQSGDVLGEIRGYGYDTANSVGAKLQITADAEWGTAGDTTDNPTAFIFTTAEDGSGTQAERMRLTSGGNLGIGVTPNERLTVSGSGNFTNNISVGNIYIWNNGTGLCLGTC